MLEHILKVVRCQRISTKEFSTVPYFVLANDNQYDPMAVTQVSNCQIAFFGFSKRGINQKLESVVLYLFEAR